jgi:hypothetical protein
MLLDKKKWVHLYFSVEEARVNFSLLLGEEADVIKMKHLPIGRPIL